MRRPYLLIGISVLALLLSGCIPLFPTFNGFNIEDGTYVDPREDLEVEWDVSDTFGMVKSFDVLLNGDDIGTTESNSFVIGSEHLNWGRDYTLEIVGKNDSGDEVLSASVTFHTYVGALDIHVVDANSGPAVSGAEIYLNGENTGKFTDENGEAELLIEENPVDLLLKKDGFALSGVKGLSVEGEMHYKVLLRKAQINPNPEGEELPMATVTFYTDASKTTLADLDNVTSLYVVVEADGKHPISIIYAAAGKIPGAGFFGNRLYFPATNTAEGYVDLSGMEGKTDVHVVLYDTNDNRVDYVFYANVIEEGETAGEKYEVIKWSALGYTNIDAYTRRSEIEFYSIPFDPKRSKIGLAKDLGMKPLSAPKDSNLWIDVWFIDYDLAAYYYGLIDPSSVEKPEAYVIYRSFDGLNWERAGVVKDTAGFDLVFRDSDPRLSPGKKVYYKVSAYYPDGESTPIDLGWVVPLDSFNVDLESPADGETNVSRDPTFVWKPTNDAFAVIPDDVTFDGTYTYTLWIYDLVQSENHLVPLTEDGYQLFLESSQATEMSLQFSSVPWGIIALDFGVAAYLYPYDKLEANKTYEWAVDLAYAYATFSDDEGNINDAYSIAIDEGYKVDYFGVHGDIYNTFTTGLE